MTQSEFVKKYREELAFFFLEIFLGLILAATIIVYNESSNPLLWQYTVPLYIAFMATVAGWYIHAKMDPNRKLLIEIHQKLQTAKNSKPKKETNTNSNTSINWGKISAISNSVLAGITVVLFVVTLVGLSNSLSQNQQTLDIIKQRFELEKPLLVPSSIECESIPIERTTETENYFNFDGGIIVNKGSFTGKYIRKFEINEGSCSIEGQGYTEGFCNGTMHPVSSEEIVGYTVDFKLPKDINYFTISQRIITYTPEENEHIIKNCECQLISNANTTPQVGRITPDGAAIGINATDGRTRFRCTQLVTEDWPIPHNR